MNNFRNALGAIALTTVFAATFAPANAHAVIMESGAIESDGSVATIDHWYFSVNTSGNIQIDVTDLIPANDHEMNLRFDDGTGNIGAFIENDDDGGPGLDPRINRFLDSGDYVLLVGVYSLPNNAVGFTDADNEPPSSPYDLNISGDTAFNFVREGNLDGSFTLRGAEPASVPEPTTLALLGLGLVGLGIRRFPRAA